MENGFIRPNVSYTNKDTMDTTHNAQIKTLKKENDKFREAVNRLVDTHNAQVDEIDALKKELARYSNPHSRYVGIDFSSAAAADLKKENAKLKKKYEAYEKQDEQAKKDALITTMLDTGLDEMVYHLGFCSDVLGDSWVPEYETGGLAGLKKILRESSTYVHGNSECSTCHKFIASIHD